MLSTRKVLFGVLGTAVVLLIALNMLFAIFHGPQVEEAVNYIKQPDWHLHAHKLCEDLSESCSKWVERGGCRWDWTTQNLCKLSCDRCDHAHEALHKPDAVAIIPGMQDLSMQKKQQAASVMSQLEAARIKIAHVNQARLTRMRLQPGTCQTSESQALGSAIHHNYMQQIISPHGTRKTSIQAACRFDLLPVKGHDEVRCHEDAGECADAAMRCHESDYATVMSRCPVTCGVCSICTNHDKDCVTWANDEGQCLHNTAFMLDKCPAACNACALLIEPKPPALVALWNGLLMPTIGFGTAGLGAGAQQAVENALDLGYRHLDSAQSRMWYREDLNGAALKESEIPRDEVFITTKIHPEHLGYDETLLAFNSSLRDFGTDYIDLVLLHYPRCFGDICRGVDPKGTWRGSWQALERLVEQGLALAIGVSNFDAKEIVELAKWAHIPPAVVQRHSDVFAQDIATQRLVASLGMRYTAYSGLGTQHASAGRLGSGNPIFKSPAIAALALKHGVTPAQVVLRYGQITGQIILPRSTSRTHMKENLELDDIHFSREDVLLLRTLDHSL